MKPYYNDKKYYIDKALKIAKEHGNKEAIIVLNILKRHYSTMTIEHVKRINSIKIYDVDLFNIENNM